MLKSSVQWLVRLPRLQKRLLQIVADFVLLTVCFLAAMYLRLDSFYFLSDPEPWIAILATLPVTIAIFIRIGFYRAVIRYISTRALKTIGWGIAASAVFLFCFSQVFGLFVPRSVPGIYAMLAFLSVGGVRFFLRGLFFSQQHQGRKTILIYGAGSSGRDLVKVLSEGRKYIPIGFIDPDHSLHGSDVMGLRVYSPEHLPQLLSDHGVSTVMLAKPRLTRSERKEIIDFLAQFTVQVQTIPELDDIVSGRTQLSEIREVAPVDLLGRDPVKPRENLMSANVAGKTVLVTGAGGSIGSEICRQIIEYAPKALVMLEISESALYEIDMDLTGRTPVALHPLLGSVQDTDYMRRIMDRYGIDTVYHAAAYKHVPIVEANTIEGFRNNVMGTLSILKAAVESGVDAFIMVSTDKAVRPTNVMGASKRMAELVCQAYADEQTNTRISMVRFGNVLGSSGSVIPKFRDQIDKGGPVTVTHKDITRYFMSIPEAAQLVVQAGALAQGGDVFVLDMGEPVRIYDLADRLIRLSGLKPYIKGQGHGDIEIVFTELRPGEKLYEELLIGANARPTLHPRIMTASEEYLSLANLNALIERQTEACARRDAPALRKILESAPLGYNPTGSDCPPFDASLLQGAS